MKSRNRSVGTRREGASQSRTRIADVLRSWVLHHRTSAGDSLRRLLANPVASVMTWLVIGVAMALPVGLSVALDNARSVSGSWDSPSRISLFLRAEMSEQAADALRAELAQLPGVAEARLVRRDEALVEFQQLSGFGDVLQHLDENPLPNLILVSPALGASAAEQAQALQQTLAGYAGVDEAVLDMEWVQRLNSLMQLVQRLVTGLGALLALGVLLVIGNTIRLSIENRRDEIIIVKLVGGSDPFVRRPFLYTGLWYGLGGALIAWLVISLTLWWLRAPLAGLALLYQSDFSLMGLGVLGSLQLLALGALLGLFGSWLAVSRHLLDIQPR